MEELQMVIKAPQENDFLREIRWNRDEFEAEVERAVKDYVGVVYGDDQIQDAKKARAELNNAKRAISARRVEVKKRIMEPYEKFDAEIKEITAKIDSAIEGIDVQIKAYDAQKKNEKRDALHAFYDEIKDGLDRYGVTFDHIWSDRMLNSSVSLKKCKEDRSPEGVRGDGVRSGAGSLSEAHRPE